MSGPPKTFVIKHEFVNMAKMQYGRRFYGEKQKHFDCSWRICVYRDKGKLMYGLECLKNHDNWWIEAVCDSKLITNARMITANNTHFFKYDDYWNATKWNFVRKNLTGNGNFTLEFNVQIKEFIANQESNKSVVKANNANEITLIVENQEILIHKNTLASQSSYFKALLSQYPQQKRFTLPHTDIDDFYDLLDVLEQTLAIDDDTVDPVLLVAFTYRFEGITQMCEQFLIDSSTKPRIGKLEIAERFKLEKLKTHLYRFDESEHCVISTESLRCTVCYEIFEGTPQTLECGHSFCSNCMKNLIGIRQPGYNVLNCPMCRKSVDINKIAPNYTLKAILETIDELSQEKEREAYNQTMNAANERLRQKCVESDKKVHIVTTEKNNNEKRLDSRIQDLIRERNHLEKSNNNNNGFSIFRYIFIVACGCVYYYWFRPQEAPPPGIFARIFGKYLC